MTQEHLKKLIEAFNSYYWILYLLSMRLPSRYLVQDVNFQFLLLDSKPFTSTLSMLWKYYLSILIIGFLLRRREAVGEAVETFQFLLLDSLHAKREP